MRYDSVTNLKLTRLEERGIKALEKVFEHPAHKDYYLGLAEQYSLELDELQAQLDSLYSIMGTVTREYHTRYNGTKVYHDTISFKEFASFYPNSQEERDNIFKEFQQDKRVFIVHDDDKFTATFKLD